MSFWMVTWPWMSSAWTGLSQLLRTKSSGRRTGGVVHDCASGSSDSLDGDHGEDVRVLPPSVRSFADTNHIPVVQFRKGDRKIDVMGRYLAVQAAASRKSLLKGWV
jgi:hypothetical protein